MKTKNVRNNQTCVRSGKKRKGKERKKSASHMNIFSTEQNTNNSGKGTKYKTSGVTVAGD